MRYSLRKTPSHLHLAYVHGEASDALIGRRFALQAHGTEFTLCIDMTANFQTRNQAAACYLEAMALVRNHDKLRYLQCDDNLVRSRLIRNWETVQAPSLRMDLDLGERGCYLYEVRPHSLLMGGIQFDVLKLLGHRAAGAREERAAQHHAETST